MNDDQDRTTQGQPSVSMNTSLEHLPERKQWEIRHIAELIPPERRGHYSDDPAIREAAKGTEIYPWADVVEGQVPRM